MDEVAQVGQQLVVVLVDEVLPGELRVALLGAVYQQVVPPHLSGDLVLELDGVGTEDAGAVALGELATLVVEVLGSGDVVEEGPALLGGDEGGGEDDGVEGHVVLPHELEELHLLADPPVLVVLLQQVGRDRDVADGRIKPHVEHLLLKLLDRHAHAPLQVPRDALRLQPHRRPRLRYRDRVLRPVAVLGSVVDPLLELVLDGRQVDEEVHRLTHLRRLLADVAEVLLQLSRRVEGLLALVALVTTRVTKCAVGTGTHNKTVGQPQVTVLAVALRHLLLGSLVFRMDVKENLLRDLGVPLGAGPAEVVKADIEPLVDLGVDLVVEVADLLGRLLLLHRLHLRGSPVLVSPADVEHVGALQLLEAGEDVGRQHAPDDVAEVGHVVDVGQGRRDQHVVLVLSGQAGVGLQHYLLPREQLPVLLGYFNLFHLSPPLPLPLSLPLGLLRRGDLLHLLLLRQFLILGGESLLELAQLLFGESHAFAFGKGFRILSAVVFILLLLRVLLALLRLHGLLTLLLLGLFLHLNQYDLYYINIKERQHHQTQLFGPPPPLFITSNYQNLSSLIFFPYLQSTFQSAFHMPFPQGIGQVVIAGGHIIMGSGISYIQSEGTVELQSLSMGKQFQEARGGSFQRGSFGGRGGSRGRGGSFNNNRGGFDQGPPSYVIPYGVFLHKSENHFVVKCTDMSRFPKFNRGVYLDNKSKVGSVDEILGPLNAFYFSVKPAEGVNPSSFREGQVFYMAPEDLLSTDRFTKPQAPRPKGPPRQFGADRGRPQQGGRGGFGGGFNNRGRGAPRGAPRGRGSFRGR